jgi:hypothetical protein
MKRILVVSLGLAVPLLGLAVPAVAGPRDDVLYGISRCGGIAEDRTWLDCVYGAAQPMRAQLGLPPAPAAQQKLVPPAMPGMATPSFGGGAAVAAEPAYRPNFFERLMTPKDYKDETPTTLKSYKFDGAGFFTVTLANGETWRQDGGDITPARWNKPAQSYKAQIVADPSGSSSALIVDGVRYVVNKQR